MSTLVSVEHVADEYRREATLLAGDDRTLERLIYAKLLGAFSSGAKRQHWAGMVERHPTMADYTPRMQRYL